MALPELTQTLVETKLGGYCDKRITAHAREQVRMTYSVLANAVTLFEERQAHDQPGKWTKMPIAQFRLNVVDHLWRLYCPNPKRAEGWVVYPDAEPAKDFDALLAALDQDKTGAFWG